MGIERGTRKKREERKKKSKDIVNLGTKASKKEDVLFSLSRNEAAWPHFGLVCYR